MARTTAKERMERLRRLQAAIEAHRGALLSALQKDFRKHPTETDMTEPLPTLQELRLTIAHLPRWLSRGG